MKQHSVNSILLTNYHTHCNFCDGSSDPETYVLTAIEKGFSSLGFSSHAPVPFETDWTMKRELLPEYVSEIRKLQDRYRERIDIYLGLEIDFLPGEMGPSGTDFTGLGLDYTLGSVHFVENTVSGTFPTMDGPEDEFSLLLEKQFSGDIKALISHYYSLVRQMVQDHRLDMLGHMDLYRVQNSDGRWFDEQSGWHREAVLNTLEEIAAEEIIIEVNTGGWFREKVNSVYPAPWILEHIREFGIPITVNTDTHTPEAMDAYYLESLTLLEHTGFKNRMVMQNGVWEEIPLR